MVLPLAGELLDVIAIDATPSGSVVDLSCDPSGPPYDCAPIGYANQVPQTLTLSDDGGRQSLVFTSTLPSVFNEVQLVIRLQPAPSCEPITGRFVFNVGETPIELPVGGFGTACNEVPDALLSEPEAPIVLNRGGGPTQLSIAASLSDGRARINRLSSVRCRAADGNTVSCTDPGFLSENIFAVSNTADFPSRVTLQAIDGVDPPTVALAGELVTELVTGTSTRIEAFPIRIEPLPVATLELDGPTQLGLGEEGAFTVRSARNQLGGGESRSVTWTIDPASVPSDLDPSAWLTTAGEFRAPESIGLRSSLTITVIATPMRFAADLERTRELVLTDGRPLVCELRSSREVIGVGEQEELVLVSVRGEEARVEPSSIVWGAEGGMISSGMNPAIFNAPSVAGSVLVTAQSPVCGETAVTQELQVVDTVSIALALTRDRLQAGDTSVLTIGLDAIGLDALPPLRLAIEASDIVRLGEARALEGELQVAARSGTSSRTRTVDWRGSSDSTQIRVPLIARGSRSGSGAIQVRVTYAPTIANALVEPIASAAATLHVEPDPEVSESTLFGDVFVDLDRDGVYDREEPGLPGVTVATSASSFVVSDAQGRFSIPRMNPVRTVIKIDRGSLPVGYTPTTDERRVITLTRGQFHQVRFGVAPPSESTVELAVTQAGLDVTADAMVYVVALSASAPGQLRVFTTNAELPTRRKSTTEFQVELGLDHPDMVLLFEEPGGRHTFFSSSLKRYAHPEGGEVVSMLPPRALGSLMLPLGAPPSVQPTLLLSLHGLEEFDIEVGPQPGRCETTVGVGYHRCSVRLEATDTILPIRIDPSPDAFGYDPTGIEFGIAVAVDPISHFFVGRFGVEGGFDPQSDAENDRWNGVANGSFYYRGRLSTDVELTAGADADVESIFFRTDGDPRPFRGVAARLLGHDSRRIFRDLDPENYYPTYGDASEAIDERESGGRFFFRLRVKESILRWGGVNTALDDAWVGRYVRSLYGFGGELRTDDELGVRGTVFAAQPDSAAARDEFLVTGSSLYLLRHQPVVEGSVRITLETLDELSGLAVSTSALLEGTDFEVDHASGRIVLDPSRVPLAGAPQLTALGGGAARRRILVEYEYLPSGSIDEDWSVGANLRKNIGNTEIGITAVSELQGARGERETRQNYGLLATSIRSQWGESLRLRVDVARSEGQSHAGARSLDGGLRFDDGPGDPPEDGVAVATEVSSELGPLSLRAYGRFRQAGFSDSRTTRGERLAQAGLRSAARWSGNQGWLLVDHSETRRVDAELRVENTAVAGASKRFSNVDTSVEARWIRDPRRSESRSIVGAQIGWLVQPRLTLTARRAQPVSGELPPGENALGLDYVDPESLHGRGELGVDDHGRPFGRAELGVPLANHDELYAGLERPASRSDSLFARPGATDRLDSLLLGGRRQLADGTRLYAEQRVSADARERRTQRAVGFDLPLGAARWFLSYSRSALDLDPIDALSAGRDALSVGVGFGQERIRARLNIDARRDGGEQALYALGGSGRLDIFPRAGLALALALRGGESFVGVSDRATTARAWEGSAGFAWRTLPHLSWFGRYSFDVSQDPLTEELADERSRTQIVATALAWDVHRRWTIGPKASYRVTRAEVEATELSDYAALVALRGDYHMSETWDLSVEGRTCLSPGSSLDAQYGALSEAALHVLRWLRLGIGYNFSPIGASSVQCQSPTARGLFIRAEALY
ncbi:MAG: hypothetical protein AAFV32_05600 [Myxococcota bacterium]